ncbi:MAG TPA: AtpZ/AtpI family protein [Beijerinckiaceae bacterium]|jgi:ATP synthase protein I
MTDGSGRDDDEALKARLERLSSALEERRAREPRRTGAEDVSASSTGRALNLGMRVLSEFVAGIITGAVIGWALDRWLSTKPWFLLVFLTLGTAAGFWNVYRLAAGTSGPRRGDRQ